MKRINIYGDSYLDKDKNIVVVREKCAYYDEKIDGPKSIVDLANKYLRMENLILEQTLLITLDNKLKVKNIFKIAKGIDNASFCRPREIFMHALWDNANSIIIVHNHPSGDCSPSDDDIEIAKRIKKIGEEMRLPLLDNIIIGRDGYYSMKAMTVIF